MSTPPRPLPRIAPEVAGVIAQECRELQRASSLLACIVTLLQNDRAVDVIDPANTARAHIDHAVEVMEAILRRADGLASTQKSKR
jgi:hypothetical protein